MTTKRLHEISAAFLEIEAALLENGGELTPEISASMDGLIGDLESKVAGYASLIRQWEAESKMWKDEESRCAGHRKARENSAARLKERLQEEMQRMGRDKIDAGLFKVALQANPIAMTVRVEADELPEHYRTIIPAQTVVAKADLLADMKAVSASANDVMVALVQRGDGLSIVPVDGLTDADIVLAQLSQGSHVRIR